MPRTTPQPDPEELHKDLLATMAASRELGPEMDKALVDSYMERHPELKGVSQQALTQPQQSNKPDLVGLTGMGVGMIGYVTLLIVTHGEMWWMFWPMMGWAGWRWGNGGRHAERHAARSAVRQARFDARIERRMNRYGVPYIRVTQPSEAEPERPAAIPPAPPVTTPPTQPTDMPVRLPPINPAG